MYKPFQELAAPQEVETTPQDYNTTIQNDIKSTQQEPTFDTGINDVEEKRLSDYMLNNGFSQQDYVEVRDKKRLDTEQAKTKAESDESFFKKLYVEPMTDEDIRESEDFFSKETFLNQWEWFAKNVVWWLSNIVTWLADIVVKWVKWVPWAVSSATEYTWDVLTWEKELWEVWEDIAETWGKVADVAKAIWSHYKKTYWSLEWFQEEAMNNPTWMIWDVLTVMTGWAAIASKVNKVQKASLLAQKGAYTDAMVNAVWLEAKKQVMMNSIKISQKIADKTKNITSISKGIQTANKFNPYLAWPKLAWQTAKLWPKLVWVWAETLHLTPSRLISSTMKLKPSDMAKINKMIGKEWDFTQWMTEKWIIRGSKIRQGREWIVTKLQDFNTNAYDSLNKAIKGVKGTFKNTNVEKWLQALEKQFKWVVWLEDDLLEIQKLITQYKTGWLTLREITKVKRKIDQNLSLYKATWAAKEWAAKTWLVKVRQWIREFIEDTWKQNNIHNIKQLSSDIRVSRGLWDALTERIATSNINNLVNLSDSLLSIPLLAWADPMTMWLYFIGKKIFETPAFKLSVLKWVYQFPKDLIRKVKAWIALTEKESLQYWALMSKYVKDRWAKLKTDLKEVWAKVADDLADKTKVRSKFIQEGGKKLDDFKTVWTTKSATLKQTKELAKDKYDIDLLKKIGKVWEWSDRVVYDIWNNQVLKVAKNTRWLDQNLWALSTDLQKAWIIPKVHEVWKDFVRMDRVKTFAELTKAEQKIVNNLVKDIWTIRGKKPSIAEIDRILKKYWWEDLGKLDYQTFGWGDIKPANLSVVKWKPILLDEWTINLVSTSNKYKNKIIKGSITAWWVAALSESALDWTLYKIFDRWIWWDVLKSNTLTENQEFLTPRW